jgi:hypothetical protein
MEYAAQKSIRIFYSLFVIYTYIRIKEFRKQPGDIFMIIAIEELFDMWLDIIQNPQLL